jgi:DNA-binding HxlR family transcriptional regulator
MADRNTRSREPGSIAAPAPGKPVRGSTSGRAIMALLDLLGRRWTLRVIWELRDAPLVFRALQARCEGMSSSVLNQRLGELRAAGIVQPGGRGYVLTAEGRRLLDALSPISAWADRWARRAPGASSRATTGGSARGSARAGGRRGPDGS